jgi:hypothetical protein
VALVRLCTTLVEATTVADLLASNGIPASVVGGVNPFGSGSYAVNTTVENLSAARELLRRLEPQPIDDPAAIDAAAVPDLTRLDPRTPAPCPGCGVQLPLDAALASCPSCGVSVDVAAVLLDRYGPELLSACYDIDPPAIPDEVLDAAHLSCWHCEYPLKGLPRTGLCPECGHSYDKATMLRPDQSVPSRGAAASPETRCAGCGYSLAGLSRHGVCPESGRPYVHAGLPAGEPRPRRPR